MLTRFLPLRQLPWLLGCAVVAIIALFGLGLYLEPGQPWQRWHWLALSGIGLALALLLRCGYMAWNLRCQLGSEPAQLAQLARQIAPGLADPAPLPCKPDENVLMALHAARAASLRWVRQSERNLGNLAAAGNALTRSVRDLAGHDQRNRHSVQQVRKLAGQLARSLGQHNRVIEQAQQAALRALRLAQSSSQALQQASCNLKTGDDALEKMRELVGTMENMAMQSTLLALDASVEAARSASCSPSFGQMAAQMRDLAQTAAESSHQIRDLLQQSTRQTALAEQTSRIALQDTSELLHHLQQDVPCMALLLASGHSQSALARQLDPYLCELELQTRRHGVLQERAVREVHAVEAHCAEQLVLQGGFAQTDAAALSNPNPNPSPARACPLPTPAVPAAVSTTSTVSPVPAATPHSAQIISFQQAVRKRPRRQVIEDWEQF